MSTSDVEVLVSINSATASESSFPLLQILGWSGEDPSGQVPGTHMWDLDGGPALGRGWSLEPRVWSRSLMWEAGTQLPLLLGICIHKSRAGSCMEALWDTGALASIFTVQPINLSTLWVLWWCRNWHYCHSLGGLTFSSMGEGEKGNHGNKACLQKPWGTLAMSALEDCAVSAWLEPFRQQASLPGPSPLCLFFNWGMKVERKASQLSFSKALLGEHAPPLSRLGSIKVSSIGEDGSRTAEIMFTSTAVAAARLHSPAASIPAPLLAEQGDGQIEWLWLIIMVMASMQWLHALCQAENSISHESSQSSNE